MTRKRKTLLWILAVVIIAAAGVTLQLVRARLRRLDIAQVAVNGAVLRRDSDPQKQSPIANVQIIATGGLSTAYSTSDASGHFSFSLRPGVLPGQPVTLKFSHPGYLPFEISPAPRGLLYVVRMEPVPEKPVGKPERAPSGVTKAAVVKVTESKVTEIKNVRVRYSSKTQTTTNVGAYAKPFQVINTGNIPCDGHSACSPNGRWKATVGELSFDAGEGNEYRNIRVSCVAGPCPFTKIEPEDLATPRRVLKVSVLNWSDTASFMLEADVTRTMVTNQTRRSFPFMVGQTLTFALPGDAEGTCIEAELNGEQIIFPLGPKLSLSWAGCNVEIVPGQSRIYRCEVKPGYQIQQQQ